MAHVGERHLFIKSVCIPVFSSKIGVSPQRGAKDLLLSETTLTKYERVIVDSARFTAFMLTKSVLFTYHG